MENNTKVRESTKCTSLENKLKENRIRDEQHLKKIRETLGKCSNCYSVEDIVQSQQTRSVDTGEMIFIRCAGCLKEIYKFQT